MIIEIPVASCEHLKSISCYNNNYYKLPFKINDYDVIFEHCDEEYNSYMYFLGTEEEGEFDTSGSDGRSYFSCDYGFEYTSENFICLLYTSPSPRD